tara:strand:+ start:931 stop:1260 length:330 start_codon:yes stop_codon:yes gene_type:complete
MPTLTLLADRTGYNEVVSECRDAWVFGVLESLGLDLEILEEAPDDIRTEYLLESRVDVYDYPDLGAVKISLNREVVGEWAGPEFQLMEDDDSSLYYKVTIEHWSVFDDE